MSRLMHMIIFSWGMLEKLSRMSVWLSVKNNTREEARIFLFVSKRPKEETPGVEDDDCCFKFS